ncbi:MAG: hypothetical protein QOH86_1533 [Sphingomonadales bacterium]|nr:hypothetical protein [Sphingomonadales bacterium]
MSDNSAIEWTDASWNPVRARRTLADGTLLTGWHCEHVSEGCRNCYAEGFNRRLGTKLDYKPGHLRSAARPGGEVEIFLDETMLLLPLRWKRPRRIFVGSMTDIFAAFVADEWLDRMFAVMALCPQHVFQLLTKRPERMRRYFEYPRRLDGAGANRGREMEISSAMGPLQDSLRRGPYSTRVSAAGYEMGPLGGCVPGLPLPNVWLGTSIEDPAALIDRAGHLRKTPAAVRFFSCEPLIGDLGQIVLDGIDWVICGGESGPGARPMHPDWARSLRDQCAAAGVPFFFKQWGEWVAVPVSKMISHQRARQMRVESATGLDTVYWRIGKNQAGRRLDGVEHNAMPAPAGAGG